MAELLMRSTRRKKRGGGEFGESFCRDSRKPFIFSRFFSIRSFKYVHDNSRYDLEIVFKERSFFFFFLISSLQNVFKSCFFLSNFLLEIFRERERNFRENSMRRRRRRYNKYFFIWNGIIGEIKKRKGESLGWLRWSEVLEKKLNGEPFSLSLSLSSLYSFHPRMFECWNKGAESQKNPRHSSRLYLSSLRLRSLV